MSVADVPSRLVDPASKLEQLATGFGFTEGPVWNASGHFLVFSDIPGDTIHCFDEVNGVRDYRRPSRMANGNAYDGSGRLLSCEHATSRLVRQEGDDLVVLAESFEGRELNSPNDVVVARDGSVWFTDPTYGRSDYYGVPRDPALEVRGLYRIADGELQLMADDFAQPNGLCFSLDGTTLMVNDTERGHIRSFVVSGDGSLSGGEVWAELSGAGPGGADGMKLDGEGDVWCTGPGGIHVFDPGGSLLGRVAVPEVVGNHAWGGLHGDELFICASSSLYRLRTVVRGHLPF
ncbi:MAG TPA: SMP-30/gluconolactonase/LRE family protein [Acidimicrobiales bacterium]|nr:SMP-30/gluconolactonase/LRE family protein [Acidimicrobiales bacterium]